MTENNNQNQPLSLSNGIGPVGERNFWASVELLRQWEELWVGYVNTFFRNNDTDANGHRYADRWDYGITSSRNLENNTPLTGCAACIATQVGRWTCRRDAHSSKN